MVFQLEVFLMNGSSHGNRSDISPEISISELKQLLQEELIKLLENPLVPDEFKSVFLVEDK